ncbi:MAG: ribosome assembly RNA-binding protein YhbY [Lachnospiraceae bacterium]|nr:ribosome assembly RNA-binding protein YhbY [Lachnospiraceae bacterium]
MTSKERAFLRSQAQLLEPVVQIGRDGLNPECTKNTDDALTARELVKINVQRNCLTPVREVAEMLSERTRSQIVQVIGRKFVLYRYSSEKKNHIPLKKDND